MYGSFQSKKKAFKLLVRQKNRERKENLINKIIQSQDKNPELFWKLIKKQKGGHSDNKEMSPITNSKWELYFKSLHNTPLSDNSDTLFNDFITKQLSSVKLETKSDLLDSPITNEEILVAIRKLKTRKACGPDGIKTDMLKAGRFILVGCLNKLFNMIFKSIESPLSVGIWFYCPDT